MRSMRRMDDDAARSDAGSFRPIGWWARLLDQRITAAMARGLAGWSLDRLGWQVLNQAARAAPIDRAALERIKLFKLIWDAIGTEFGGRHELYERNYAGNNEQIRVDVVNFAKRRGILDHCHQQVEQCLSDYDLDGWRDPTWQFDKT